MCRVRMIEEGERDEGIWRERWEIEGNMEGEKLGP